MGTIWVKELTGGLDVRRLPEATPGGVLIRGSDGHITRGGEFETRAAFVPWEALPDGTVGLAHDKAGLVVFGSDEAPTMPSGVSYQRLEHPTGQALTDVLSFDLYNGLVYVVGQFADGSIYHFYDATLVDDWFDGRARAAFRVTGGTSIPAKAATASFTVTGGTSGVSNELFDLTVGGVSVIGSAVAHTGSDATTAAAIAAEINSVTTTPNYTATSTDQQVTITAADTGPGANGRSLVPVTGGDMTVGGVVSMAGGSDVTTSKLTDLRVAGVSAIDDPVSWAGSNEATAAAIAAEVTSATSAPEYTATAVGDLVNVVAATAGEGENGKTVTLDVADGLTLSATSVDLAQGADTEDTFTPGSFVKTVRSKMYSVSGPLLHFSGISAPTQWTTDAIGAGFENMAAANSGSETLTAVARYQNLLAIFSPTVVQIWFIDPDPTLNVQSQVLDNTGTDAPKSVTKFGDSDVFYLDESGLRSLRARDSSNAASTTDIGVPVDDLITAKIQTLTDLERRNVIGLINPIDKRFWLIVKDEIFVFSFYENAKVSAWTTYNTTTPSGSFDVDDAVVFARRPYLRSGNTIYVYGGVSGALTYDETEGEAWLPYLDANRPTADKDWNGIDAALTGLWEVSAAMEPNDIDAAEVIARVSRTSYNGPRIPFTHASSHVSLRFRSKGTGPAKLSSATIHYEGDADED